MLKIKEKTDNFCVKLMPKVITCYNYHKGCHRGMCLWSLSSQKRRPLLLLLLDKGCRGGMVVHEVEKKNTILLLLLPLESSPLRARITISNKLENTPKLWVIGGVGLGSMMVVGVVMWGVTSLDVVAMWGVTSNWR